MFTKNLKFQYDAVDRNKTKVVLLPQLLAIGLNGHGLEILHSDPTSKKNPESVQSVRGENLDLVWDDLVFNRLHFFVNESVLSKEAMASISQICPQTTWSRCDLPIVPDQNTARKDCLQFESRTFRHLWPRQYLIAFAVLSNRKLLLQFKDQHCYVLTPFPEAFVQIRDQILNENLDYGCLNQFTVADASEYVDIEPPRYIFQSIEYKYEDLASRGEWSILLGRRLQPSPPLPIPISPVI